MKKKFKDQKVAKRKEKVIKRKRAHSADSYEAPSSSFDRYFEDYDEDGRRGPSYRSQNFARYGRGGYYARGEEFSRPPRPPSYEDPANHGYAGWRSVDKNDEGIFLIQRDGRRYRYFDKPV